MDAFRPVRLSWQIGWVLALVAGCGRSAVRKTAEVIAPGEVVAASFEVPASAAPAPDAEMGGPHPVDFYVDYALANNPSIHAAILEVEAAEHRIPQARSLEDPMLMAKGYPFFPNTPQTASGRATGGVGVSQKFPWFGKRTLQGAVAEEELHIAQARLESTRLEVIEQVRRTYLELYYAQQAIRITQQNRKALEQIAEVADSQYRAGLVSQQDVLRAQTELANVDAELLRLQQELISNQARLIRLLHAAPGSDVRAEEKLADADVRLELNRLYERAVAARPELQAELHAIERERRSVELAGKQYFPDATLGADWMEMTTHKAMAATADGLDDVGLSLTVNLPIYHSRLDAAVREAEARTLAAARRYDSERDQTIEMVRDLFAQAESQREVVRLLRDSILPKARQTLQVSLAGYGGGQGKVDFLQLLSNFQEVLKVELMLERQRTQLHQTLSSLARVVGGDLHSGAQSAVPTEGEPKAQP